MKRFNSVLRVFIAGAFYLAMVSAPKWAMAASPISVTVSTAVPNGSVNGAAAFTAAGYPNVTGGAKIRKIYLTNQGGTAAGETVSIWNTCTSSTAATIKWQGVVAATTNVNVDFLPNGFGFTSPCISRGINDTLSVIKATIVYE